ncbi:MAG: hypothetical protein HC849_09290 [Oscillatoriales cyanobacterium RU_3_3]|nr:hypothetical protein [Microcoleus sp. SU_5_6]NJL69189.1 hypothetical protein [Microcoleus sp. SM1_3_4]NJM60335.1 hypothetical protein [Oscillatoriales cyanobacterium RU_3_3]NJR22788.1 hypothetical protein [Richelia sp. CSU_2_1]
MVKNTNNPQKGSIWGYLTLLLPISLTAVASFESGGMFWTIAATAGLGWAYKLYQQQEKNKLARLDEVFYRLIKENQGRVTALDLAMNAKLPGEKTQQYLDDRAKEFAADFEVTEQGGILYYFQTAKPEEIVANIPQPAAVQKVEIQSPKAADKSPELFPIAKIQAGSNPKISFTQTELSRRFKVHANTISKWKIKAEFPEWSRQKDPEAIAWEYSTENKRFYPKD